jgi:hypothetical protein
VIAIIVSLALLVFARAREGDNGSKRTKNNQDNKNIISFCVLSIMQFYL